MTEEVEELFAVDDETLKHMPEWFRLLREAYVRKHRPEQAASRVSRGPA
jgi:hypothetical protein